MTLRCSCLVTALCLSTALTTSEAAASTATSDAQAVAILTKALAALNGATVARLTFSAANRDQDNSADQANSAHDRRKTDPVTFRVLDLDRS